LPKPRPNAHLKPFAPYGRSVEAWPGFLIVSYRTDPDALAAVIPAPLEMTDPIVKFEFIRMPNSTGFGDYDCEPPIAGGREIWGFPKKLASPELRVEKDTIGGILRYGPVPVALATMGYKYRELPHDKILASLLEPNFLLKIIPHVDGTPRICELVRGTLRAHSCRFHRGSGPGSPARLPCFCEHITVKGAWEGPAALELFQHALAPVASLPILEVISGVHIQSDLTLGLGTVVYDYLAQ
jgi:acetoacetate decarboxylase